MVAEMQGCDWQTSTAGGKQGIDHHEVPTCAVCMEKLGTYGGPSSLACGHNGCLECLKQVQSHNIVPLCPLCRTPFDQELQLAPNLDLKDALEKLDFVALYSGMGNKQQMKPFVGDIQSLDAGSLMPAIAYSKDVTDLRSGVSNVFHPCERAQGENNVGDMAEYPQSEVNIWTIAKGVLAILMGRTKRSLEPGNLISDNYESEDTVQENSGNIWDSVYLPSAPPLLTGPGEDSRVLRAVLEADPPQWVPDSACRNCMQCNAKFQPLSRGRHHCRFCGGIFCRSCSTGRCLLPVKFMERDPQRVCDACYEKLESTQYFLSKYVSNAAQIAIHDVTDPTCMRGWVNNPLGMSMQDEIYKATNTLRRFCKTSRLKPELAIPEAVLKGAKGLAILTVVKVGVVLTYKLGTGLIVAKRDDGSWSPPSAIMSCGLAWGLQVGGELIDFIIVLPSTKAVKAFGGRAHVSVGAGISASVGPLGRAAEADLRVGDGGAATCYTYSCSQGAFVGVSFEGNVVAARADTNARFYGDSYLTPEDILFGHISTPRAAAPLYAALQDLCSTMGL